MRLFPFTLLALAALTLSACVGSPWVDRRREAGKPNTFVGASTLDQVAICYASEKDMPEITRLAETVCSQTDRSPTYARTSKWSCRLSTPHHIFFDCN